MGLARQHLGRLESLVPQPQRSARLPRKAVESSFMHVSFVSEISIDDFTTSRKPDAKRLIAAFAAT
jgi:hypothetical protein